MGLLTGTTPLAVFRRACGETGEARMIHGPRYQIGYHIAPNHS